MHKLKKFTGRIARLTAVAAALFALGAASATAATWSSGYPVVAKGSVTFERSDGVAPVTCKVEETWTATQPRLLAWRCPNQVIPSYSFVTPQLQVVEGSQKPFLDGVKTSSGANPWGSGNWAQAHLHQPFVNGKPGEPSHIVMNHQLWGTFVGGPWVYVTGRINVTTPTGGLTTIVP